MPAVVQPRFFVFIATSLDGFIAREDGSLDWLDEANAAIPPGEDCGYADFIADVDALVMGRSTFETVSRFPQWPYGELPVIVLSRSLARLPGGAPPTVSLLSGSPPEVAAALARRGHRRIYLDGGRTIQAFLAAGLVSDLTVTTIPVLLGRGRPLFGPLPGDVKLRVTASKAWPFGFVQTRYETVDVRDAGA